MQQKYDAIIVGTGFSSSYFLMALLEVSRPDARILVLERGRRDTHAWRLENDLSASTPVWETFVNRNPEKSWIYTPTFGGSSSCWWACTPRMLPNDFRTRTRYGVGRDWPLSYDDLEPFYDRAERVMAVSGPDDGAPFPRNRPYPQPPHRFSDVDKLLKASFPDLYFQQPTARPRVATARRPMCCATSVCTRCPIDSKFTIQNEMADLYEDPRVTLALGVRAVSVETQGGLATGIEYFDDGAARVAKGDLIILGANAIFNPDILLRSGLHHTVLGKFLNEQISVHAVVDLHGVDNYQGSTSITGNGWMLYDGPHRSEYAGCLIEAPNYPKGLRYEPGRWRQRVDLKFIFEDLPDERNRVQISDLAPALPETVWEGHSDYAQRGIDQLESNLPRILAALPVERVEIIRGLGSTESHIQGTTVMGDDPRTSIVDRHLVHHEIRNLVVLGSSVFPTCPPANPTLTISALALWSARQLLG